MISKTKKEIFLEKTLKLIYKKGFKATTMRDIAQNMNFEVANVYNYIESKDALLEFYIFYVLDEFTIFLENILDSSYTPVEKLKLIMSKHIQFAAVEPYKFSLFIYEWRDLSKPKLAEFKKRRILYMQEVTNLIESGIAQGQLRQIDSKFATLMIFSSMRGLLSLAIEDKKLNPIEIEKQLNEFVFFGISK